MGLKEKLSLVVLALVTVIGMSWTAWAIYRALPSSSSINPSGAGGIVR